MKKTLYLANRLREVLLNGHWIANTNFKEQLQAANLQRQLKKLATSTPLLHSLFTSTIILMGY